MGRKPIGEVAMTAAERKRRSREKIKRGSPKLSSAARGEGLDISEARIAELEAKIKALDAELAKLAPPPARKRKQSRRKQQPSKRLRAKRTT